MAVDTPTDGQIAAYQASSGEFEWVDDSSGSPGGSDGDFQINNSGVFGGSILSTNKTTTITLNSGASGDPQIQMSSSTKSMTLKVDTNNKLKVEGATYSWVLDASSATGGITFPDGTTQTTAASGGGAYAKLYNPKGVTPTTYTDPLMQMFVGTSGVMYATQVGTGPYQSFYWWFPFYAQGDGKITDLRYRVTTVHSGNGTALDVGFYTSDDEGQPLTKIGTASCDLTALSNDASATITETSTDSMTLTQGELYWVAYKDNGTSGFARVWGLIGTYSPMLSISDYGTNTLAPYNCYATSTLPTTYSEATDLIGVADKSPVLLGGVFS